MLKTAHIVALTALSLLCICASSFAADYPAYDRKIEAAVKQIVAKKAGPIRGAYDFHTKVLKTAEFQAPVRPALVAVAALPAVFENVDVATVTVSQIVMSNTANFSGAPEFPTPTVESLASIKLVQVAAVANRKVRMLSSFLYY